MTAKLSLIAFISFTLSFAALAESPLTITSESQSGIFNLNYKAEGTGKVKVSILDENNQTVFSEVLYNISSFIRPYNFSGLKEGEYSIIVNDKNGSHIEKVNFSKSAETSFIRIRKMTNQNDKFIVSVISNTSEKVSVRIYDNTIGLLYDGEMLVTGSDSAIYNLSKIKTSPSSIIIFEVSTSNGKVETAMF